MKRIAIWMFVLTAVFGACSDDETILEEASDTPELSTFVLAVEFASDDGDLTALLEQSGTLTVFAPNNAAFDELAVEVTGQADADATDLLVDANKPLLRSVLQYHILGLEVRAADIPFGLPLETLEGNVFKVEPGAPPVIIDGRNRTSEIVQTDIVADNGITHIINRVLLPPNMTIGETASALAPSAGLSTLIQAVSAANLGSVLSEPGPFTVFAPTDAAFASLLAELRMSPADLLSNRTLLTQVLTYHVVPARVFAAEIPFGRPIETAEGATFTIDDSLTITDGRGRTARIVQTDIQASNGVIHLIDNVLLPPP